MPEESSKVVQPPTDAQPMTTSEVIREFIAPIKLKKSRLAFSVTCAFVSVCIIVGVLVGVKFFLDSANDTVKRSFEFASSGNRKVKEEVSTSLKDNLVQYHKNDDDGEIWVINDYNRDIQILKVSRETGMICYVTPLNRSDTSPPEAITNITAPNGDIETDNRRFDVSLSPISDKSIVGPTGQKLCENIDVHWMVPQPCPPQASSSSNGTSTLSSAGRQRRDICLHLCHHCYFSLVCYHSFFQVICYWRHVCVLATCIIPC